MEPQFSVPHPELPNEGIPHIRGEFFTLFPRMREPPQPIRSEVHDFIPTEGSRIPWKRRLVKLPKKSLTYNSGGYLKSRGNRDVQISIPQAARPPSQEGRSLSTTESIDIQQTRCSRSRLCNYKVSTILFFTIFFGIPRLRGLPPAFSSSFWR